MKFVKSGGPIRGLIRGNFERLENNTIKVDVLRKFLF